MGDFSKEILKLFLKQSDRIALGLLLLSVVLAISTLIPGTAGAWARGHTTWVAFGVLGPICYLPTRPAFEWLSKRRVSKKMRRRLSSLTKREQEILAPYVSNGWRSRRISRTDPVAQGLADDGILYAPSVEFDQRGGKAYNIVDAALVDLKGHPEWLGDALKRQSTDTGDL